MSSDLRDDEKTLILNPNHSHFIFIEESLDSQQSRRNVDEFRANFENSIKGRRVHHLVLLMIEGGHSTLKTIKRALENRIPVLMISVS